MLVALTGRVAFRGDDAAVGGGGLGAPAQLAGAFLVLERRRPVSRDELADLLWGDDLPQSWKQLVRGVIAQLRVAFREAGVAPTEAVTTAFGSYQVHLPPGSVVDVEQVDDDLAAARTALLAGDADEARRRATSAARVAARRFLPAARGLWAEAQQAALHETHLRALEAVAAAALADGDDPAAVDAAESVLAVDPYRESAYGLLMRAHAAAGNRAQALRVHERCRQQLEEGLGVAPSAATEAVLAEVLGAEPQQPVGPPPPPERRSADPGVDPGGGGRTLPPSIEALRRGPIVGREAELAAVQEAFADRSSATLAVFVTGEAGIGKSRLAAEAAASLARGQALVLHRTCDPGGGAFEPIAAIAADLIALLDRHHQPVPAPQQLVRLVPELGGRLQGGGPDAASDASVDRTALFDAVVALLAESAAVRPLVVVLEDLQWASVPTLLLVRHVLRASVGARLAVVGTFRDQPSERSEPLVDLLGEAARSGVVRRLDLRGLDVDAIAELIERAGAEPVRAQAGTLAVELHQATGGNALFAREVIRHWSDGGTGVPPAVADTVRARLLPLPTDVRDVLPVAALVGPTFDVWSLAQLTELGDDTVLGALEAAATTGLVGEVAGELDRWSFSHAVVRDVLAAELSAGRRARLHTRLGLALAERGTAAAADVAAHLLAGTPDHRADAIGWLVAAAEQALAELAFEPAVAHYERALAEAERGEAAPPERRIQIRLAHGEALRRSGLGKQARASLLAAVDLARAVGSPEALAAAAVALGALVTPRGSGRPSATATELLEEALRQLPTTMERARAEVMSHLAIQLQLSGTPDRAAGLVGEAQRIAERLDDDRLRLLTTASGAGVATDPAENRDRARAWRDAAVRVGDVDHETWARIMLVWAAIGGGRFAEARQEAVAFEQLVRRLGRPSQLWWPTVWDASRAITEGRFGDVEGLLDEARATGGDPEGTSAIVQIWLLRASWHCLTGVVDHALLAELGEFRSGLEDPAELSALDLWVRWKGGLGDGIAAGLRSAVPVTLAGGPDGNRLAYLGMLAEVAAATGADRAMLNALYDSLRPFAGRYLVLGFSGAVFGSVDRALGLLAAASDRAAEAGTHLENAVRSFDANGAVPWSRLVAEERSLLECVR